MKSLVLAVLLLPSFTGIAQKKVLSLPFEFEKKLLTSRAYDAYFLDNQGDSMVSLVLKDNLKAQYVLLNKNLGVISKIDKAYASTVFAEDIYEYRGGTANGQVFHFIYEEKEKKAFSRRVTYFQVETVDFHSKTISHQRLFEIPKAESVVSSFTDHNTYITITADNKSHALIFYVVDQDAHLQQKKVPITVPEYTGKDRNDVTEYLKNLRVFKSDEAPDLSSAVSSAKLFSRPDGLRLLINDKGHPAHLIDVSLPDFKAKEKFIELDELKNRDKDKIYVNSFLYGDKIFSLVLNKKSIKVAIHDLNSEKLESRIEITEESDFGMFAVYPVSESRMGKKGKEKEVDNIKKLIKAFDKGTEGLMVVQNEKGQYILTVGTYNLVPLSSGGTMGHYEGGWTQATPSLPSYYNSTMYYRPGTPSFTTTDARYYYSTYFKMLLDQRTLKYTRGRVPVPVPDQIKDYMQETDPKARATNQFAIGQRQFYGYYDREAHEYVVEEIRLRS